VAALETGTNKTPYFSLDGLVTKAKCVNVYDGDTIKVVFPAPGTATLYRWSVRLAGIDTAEMRTSDELEKAHAKRAKEYLTGKILNKIVEVKCGEFEKYGRLLAWISLDGETFNTSLVQKNLAYEYDGGTKKEFSEWYVAK